jgi:CRISPR-associated protein Cas6
MEEEPPVVDVVFGVAGESVPSEHAYALWQATLRWLPWLGVEARAGIHPLRTAPTGYGVALLANRAKLTLRVPQRRLPDALMLAGKTLNVGGSHLAVGGGAARQLRPWATLHAALVAAGAAGEAGFQDEVAQWLKGLGIAGDFITGRRRRVMAGEREVVGFSVVLHGLASEASLRMQCEGMGGDRALGCGIFVPHKSIATAR